MNAVAKKLKKKRLPTGRPEGIPQPDGPERMRRSLSVIDDSVLKRARAGEAEAARLVYERLGLLGPQIMQSETLDLDGVSFKRK